MSPTHTLLLLCELRGDPFHFLHPETVRPPPTTPKGPRPSARCSHQVFFSPPLFAFFSWKVKNTLAVPSFENRATPKTIRAGGREMCAENSQGAETLGLRRFSFPLSGFQKQRNSRENQGRTSPQAKTAAATPTSLSLALSYSLSLSLYLSCTHTQKHTFHGNVHRHKYTAEQQ